MVVAFVKGLQGDHLEIPASRSADETLPANSNENNRDKTSSDFDERLFHEYYAMPFRMGVVEGGSRAFMASYNLMNGVPVTINPVLESVTRKQWGQDGIICTDAGAMRNLVTPKSTQRTLITPPLRASSWHRTVSGQLSRRGARCAQTKPA